MYVIAIMNSVEKVSSGVDLSAEDLKTIAIGHEWRSWDEGNDDAMILLLAEVIIRRMKTLTLLMTRRLVLEIMQFSSRRLTI